MPSLAHHETARRPAGRQHVGADSAYYAYDANGNRTHLQDVTGTVQWTYDALDRMTLEEGA